MDTTSINRTRLGSFRDNLDLLHKQPKFKVSRENYMSAKKQAGLEFSTTWTEKERKEVRKVLQKRKLKSRTSAILLIAFISLSACTIAFAMSGGFNPNL